MICDPILKLHKGLFFVVYCQNEKRTRFFADSAKAGVICLSQLRPASKIFFLIFGLQRVCRGYILSVGQFGKL